MCALFSRSFVNHMSKMQMSSLRIGVVGVPFSKGQVRNGVEKGPTALRSAGLIEELVALGNDVNDYGDISYLLPGPNQDQPSGIRGLSEFAACTEKLSKKVSEILREERKVLTIGGDHSIAFGSVDGHIQAKGSDGRVALLWVDAHADINTVHTSETGSLHGMPVALLVKELKDYWPYLPGMGWRKPTQSMNNLAYIGLRSVDPYERFIIEKFGITAFGMEDIQKYGISEVTQRALEKINPDGTLSLHISFDIDSLDKLEAPSTGTSVRGGLTLREGIHIVETGLKSGMLSAIDIVEVNPMIGNEMQVAITVEAAVQIAKAAFGFSRCGSFPEHIKSLPGLSLGMNST